MGLKRNMGGQAAQVMVESETLKPGWKVWRFDQMAVNVNARIDDPSKADVDY